MRYRESDISRTFGGMTAKTATLKVTRLDAKAKPVMVEDLAGNGELEVTQLARGSYRVELDEGGGARVLLDEARVVPWVCFSLDLTAIGDETETRFVGTVGLEGGTPVPGVRIVIDPRSGDRGAVPRATTSDGVRKVAAR